MCKFQLLVLSICLKAFTSVPKRQRVQNLPMLVNKGLSNNAPKLPGVTILPQGLWDQGIHQVHTSLSILPIQMSKWKMYLRLFCHWNLLWQDLSPKISFLYSTSWTSWTLLTAFANLSLGQSHTYDPPAIWSLRSPSLYSEQSTWVSLWDK